MKARQAQLSDPQDERYWMRVDGMPVHVHAADTPTVRALVSDIARAVRDRFQQPDKSEYQAPEDSRGSEE